MSGAALRRMSAFADGRQALARPLLREALDEESHFVADPNQLLFPHFAEAPVVAVESGAEDAGESLGENRVFADLNLRDAKARNDRDQGDRNIRAVVDRKFPGSEIPIDTIGTDDFTRICAETLHAVFDTSSAPIKRIAQIANSNQKTAKNWWEGVNAPGPIQLLRLMAHVPEFQGRMRELAAMERDLDPELERAMAETMRLMQRIGGGR